MSQVCKEKRLSHLLRKSYIYHSPALKENSWFKSAIHQQFLSVICGAKLKTQYWNEELFFAGVKCWFTIWILADSETSQVLEGMYRADGNFLWLFGGGEVALWSYSFVAIRLPCRVIRSKAKYNYNLTFSKWLWRLNRYCCQFNSLWWCKSLHKAPH